MLGPAEKMVKVFYMDEKQTWQPYTEALLLLEPRLDEGLNLLVPPALPSSPPYNLSPLTNSPSFHSSRSSEFATAASALEWR